MWRDLACDLRVAIDTKKEEANLCPAGISFQYRCGGNATTDDAYDRDTSSPPKVSVSLAQRR